MGNIITDTVPGKTEEFCFWRGHAGISMRRAAKILGVFSTAMQHRVARNTIPHYRLNNRPWVYEQAVEIERAVRKGLDVRAYAVRLARCGWIWAYSEETLVALIRAAGTGGEFRPALLKVERGCLSSDGTLDPATLNLIPHHATGAEFFAGEHMRVTALSYSSSVSLSLDGTKEKRKLTLAEYERTKKNLASHCDGCAVDLFPGALIV